MTVWPKTLGQDPFLPFPGSISSPSNGDAVPALSAPLGCRGAPKRQKHEGAWCIRLEFLLKIKSEPLCKEGRRPWAETLRARRGGASGRRLGRRHQRAARRPRPHAGPLQQRPRPSLAPRPLLFKRQQEGPSPGPFRKRSQSVPAWSARRAPPRLPEPRPRSSPGYVTPPPGPGPRPRPLGLGAPPLGALGLGVGDPGLRGRVPAQL